MIIILTIAITLSIFVLFIGSVGCALQCATLCHWPSLVGWGGMIIFICALCGKTAEITMKEVGTAVFNRFSLFPQTRTVPAGIKIPKASAKALRNLLNGGILLISGAITILGLSEGLSPPEIKRVDVVIENLHPGLEGLTIAQISDLHIFPSTRQNWVEQIVYRTNALNPDIIALTGDIVDSDYGQINKEIKALAGLRSKYGNYFVTGNHEYIIGADSWVDEFRNLGFQVLRNEHHLIKHNQSTLLIAGVEDHSAPTRSSNDSSPAKAIGNSPKTDLKLLLAHKPHSVYEAAGVGFDLQLSGHTHGGIISPVRWLASIGQPYQSGLYQHENTQIYVSNGTGYWGIPFRLGTPSEITFLRLTRDRLE